jgi:hypothetical protein
MAIQGGVRVDGLNRTVRDLQTLGLEIDDLKEAFGDLAAEGADLASSFAPKVKGDLARTIRGNRSKNKAVVTAGKKKVAYAGAVNYGWPEGKKNWQAEPRERGGWPIGIEPAGFMEKADEELRPRALAELEDAIDRKIRERGLG